MALNIRILLAIALFIGNTVARSTMPSRTEATPRGCKWQRSIIENSDDAENSVKNILSCKLRTIGGIDNLLSNLSVYQTDRISALKLECSDVLFFESSLEASQHSGAFLGTLRNLKDLHIEYCKIRYVPSMVLKALRDLRTLSLRTHNTDWSAMNLELHPESFRGLTELKILDLADNNIWNLPTDVFCPLFSLKQLNLTKNRLTDVAQLGFADWGNGPKMPGKACNTGLETLDLSENDIATLTDASFSALRSLSSLHLQDNLLTSLADKSFAGLQSLKILNISSNRLVALPPELFQSPRELTQLYLQNNTLAVLAPGLLDGLDRLEILDLSQNELTSTWINRDTFSGLVRLVILNLGYNSLTKIDQNVFRGLYSLQILNLEHNEIEFIAENSFSDFKNLHALTLSNNKLKRIESHHLADLFVLQQLFLESNYIDYIDGRAFENLTSLFDLSLNDNRLENIPQGLNKLRLLKSLDLGKNRITTIQNISFDGLDQLLGLRLVDNLITNITKDSYAPLKSLHVLNLASNKIHTIEKNALDLNPSIRAIRLDNNLIEDINSVFVNLPELVWLNVSDNKLKWFDYSHMPASLEWLDLHKNNISELGNYFDVRNTLKLNMLDISFNQIKSIEDGSIPDTIRTLYLNNNQIKTVAPGTFLKKRSLEKVVLYGNQIRTLDIAAFTLLSVPDSREMPQFFVGNNPIHCDCHMEWLQKINELSHLRQHPRVLDLDQVQCTIEHERGAKIRPLMDLRSQDFLCRYESHCFALCHCCEFDACDCKMTCPDRCNCYHDHTWSANVVDCANAGYTEVPERIPMDATAIYLDGNDLGDLGSHLFIGKKKLELLYLNNSRINSLQNRTFTGVPSLKVLHLENNNIKELRGSEFNQLNDLNELYVDHNDIKVVGNQTFKGLKSLEVLELSDNKITDFSPWTQLNAAAESGSLTTFNMEGGNRWKCDCNSLTKLQDWIKQTVIEFDINRMICNDDRIVANVIKECQEVRESAVVTPTVQRTILMGDGLVGGNYIPILAAVLVAIIGAALLVALACVFRQDVRLWAHSKYGIRLFRDPTLAATTVEDSDKHYDAYILYSVEDSDFTSQFIAAPLHHNGYNICMHHRDIHSLTFLSDALQSAADASKKLVIVLSMNFLQKEWSQSQFRVALQTVIENIRPAHRKHKLVLILTAPIELISMDPILQLLIRTCTVICWNEKRFWDKLYYALPDIASDKSVKKHGNVSRSPNLRYTPAPTTLDAWCKAAHPGVAVPVIDHQGTTPSASTSHTEDESSCASSQHYEPAPSQNYVCRSTASSLGHVYSTIPETPQQMAGHAHGRAYFV